MQVQYLQNYFHCALRITLARVSVTFMYPYRLCTQFTGFNYHRLETDGT